ncbi:hypothetical protein N7452_006857 [Penicillium brevicompactum]|uniref:Uncharacterized protein n=1 Tax=Penicillium brevicompactum TaxID=5074 RepID=A0A9W9UCZ4_PENBR|nr:hypothetical protein N7452_006857 [Penicillium brevicompactum]
MASHGWGFHDDSDRFSYHPYELEPRSPGGQAAFDSLDFFSESYSLSSNSRGQQRDSIMCTTSDHRFTDNESTISVHHRTRVSSSQSGHNSLVLSRPTAEDRRRCTQRTRLSGRPQGQSANRSAERTTRTQSTRIGRARGSQRERRARTTQASAATRAERNAITLSRLQMRRAELLADIRSLRQDLEEVNFALRAASEEDSEDSSISSGDEY